MACAFNGTNQYLSISDSPALVFNEDFCISLFFYKTASGDGTFYSRGGGAGSWDDFNGHTILLHIESGLLSAQYHIAGNNLVQFTITEPSLNNWHNLVFTKNGSTTTAYLNSTSFGSSTTAISQNSLSNIARVGFSASSQNYLTGAIAELAIWKGAGLNTSEIAALSKGFSPDQIRPQSLSFYAPLVRNFQDVRGGLAIANNNGATVATHPRIIT